MNAHEPMALIACVGLAYAGYACTTIGHEKVEGWPTLEVREHYVSHKEMRDRCNKYAHWAMSPEACAEFNLNTKRCDIWYSNDFPPSKDVIEHERKHCQGYQHVGSTEMAEFYKRWRASQ